MFEDAVARPPTVSQVLYRSHTATRHSCKTWDMDRCPDHNECRRSCPQDVEEKDGLIWYVTRDGSIGNRRKREVEAGWE